MTKLFGKMTNLKTEHKAMSIKTDKKHSQNRIKSPGNVYAGTDRKWSMQTQTITNL